MKNLLLVLAISVFIISCKKGNEAQPQQSTSNQVATTTPTNTVTTCTSLIDTALLFNVTWVGRDTGYMGSYTFTKTTAINTAYADVLNTTTYQHAYYTPDHTQDRYYAWSIDATNCNVIHLSGPNNVDITIYEITATTIKAKVGLFDNEYFDKK